MPLSLSSDRLIARIFTYVDDLGLRRRRTAYLLGLNEHETKRVMARWEIAALRLKATLARWATQQKAGYNPDQPRNSIGRWSREGGAVESSGPIRGHHFVDKELFNDKRLNLRPETRRVFERETTGPLRAGPHRWSSEHRIYNAAVAEHFMNFLKENGITSDQMTPEQARQFVNQIKGTSDLRIRDFNLKIYRREILYWLRRLPRVND